MTTSYDTLTALEERWRADLAAIGRDAIHKLSYHQRRDFYFARDSAVDAIEHALFDSEEWEEIEATEISDVACDIGNSVAEDYWRDVAD